MMIPVTAGAIISILLYRNRRCKHRSSEDSDCYITPTIQPSHMSNTSSDEGMKRIPPTSLLIAKCSSLTKLLPKSFDNTPNPVEGSIYTATPSPPNDLSKSVSIALDTVTPLPPYPPPPLPCTHPPMQPHWSVTLDDDDQKSVKSIDFWGEFVSELPV